MTELFNKQYNTYVLDEKNRFLPYLTSALIASSPMTNKVEGKPTNTPTITQTQKHSTYKFEKSEMHNILARTIFKEARGEGETGMRAVASVIYNRGYGDPKKMVDAVIAKTKDKRGKLIYQFSCWGDMTESDWNNFKIKEESGKSWDLAYDIALDLIFKNFTPTNSYDHYYNPSKANPSWAYTDKNKTKLRPYEKIGEHYFMSLGKWIKK